MRFALATALAVAIHAPLAVALSGGAAKPLPPQAHVEVAVVSTRTSSSSSSAASSASSSSTSAVRAKRIAPTLATIRRATSQLTPAAETALKPPPNGGGVSLAPTAAADRDPDPSSAIKPIGDGERSDVGASVGAGALAMRGFDSGDDVDGGWGTRGGDDVNGEWGTRVAMVSSRAVEQQAKAPCRRAIALRDLVPPEQQLGTQAFTVPLLLSGYQQHTYVTGNSADDGRAQVTSALAEAAHEGCSVDLFFLALGFSSVSWIEDMRPEDRPALHLVYDTGGGSARYGRRWIDAGAQTFVGHRGGNVAPVFYAFFLPKLVDGHSIDDAVRQSNSLTRDILYSTGPLFTLGSGGESIDTLWHNTEAVIVR